MANLTFEVTTEWTGRGTDAVGVVHTGQQPVAWSVPASMGGNGEGSSPEELLASAVASCYTATLGSLLHRDRLPWTQLRVAAAEMVTTGPGRARINRIVVSPTVLGAEPERSGDYERLATLARDHCFVGRHLAADVAYEVGTVTLTAAGTPPPDVLDVRTLSPARRHQLIFATLDGLGVGQAVTLVNDHDPVPLRYQLEATRGESFSWEAVEAGPTTWRVRIARHS